MSLTLSLQDRLTVDGASSKKQREYNMVDLSGFENFLSSLPEGICVLDESNQVIYWNRSAERLTGYVSEKLVGKQCCRPQPDDRGDTRCTLGCLRNDDEGNRSRNHGSPASFRVHVSPLFDGEGNRVGAVNIFDSASVAAGYGKTFDLLHASQIDHLTGLYHRQKMEQNIAGLLKQLPQEYGLPFGLLFMDIDHFKSINDAYGHRFGDDALKLVGEVLASNTRITDFVGRWGGEEFIAIIINVNERQLYAIGDRYRALVEEAIFFTGDEMIKITISVGATMARPSDSLDSLVSRADSLMYRSKSAGRNRTSVDGDSLHGLVEAAPRDILKSEPASGPRHFFV